MEKEIYTIRLLENKDFDKLPYENISDSLGFADPSTGDCFIRKTGVPDWDIATIQHEIDELLSQKSFHEDADGIRHKKFFKEVFMPYIAPVVAGIATGGLGSALGLGATAAKVAGGIAGAGTAGAVKGGKPKEWLPSAALGGISGYGGAAAVPGFQAGAAASKAAGGGILGQVGSGIQSALGIQSGAQKTMEGLSKGAFSMAGDVAPGLATSQAIKAGGIIPMAGSAYTPSTTAFPNILGTTTLGALQTPKVTTVGAPTPGVTAPTAAPGITPPTVTPGAVAPTPTGLGAIAKRLVSPEGLLGAGALMAGAAPKAPEFEMPPRIAELEEAFLTQGGISEIGIAARGELLKTLQARPEELYPVADDAFIEASLRGTRESYERAAEQLDKNYNIAGVYGSGEHLAAKDKLREELAQLESDFMALEQNRRFTMAQETKNKPW